MITAAGLAVKTGEAAKAGPIGLVVILLLCVACYFLFKSMSKHMRKVREEFPSDAEPAVDGSARSDAAAGRQEQRTAGGEPERPSA